MRKVVDDFESIGFKTVVVGSKAQVDKEIDKLFNRRIKDLKELAMKGNPLDIARYNYELLTADNTKRQMKNYLYHELKANNYE